MLSWPREREVYMYVWCKEPGSRKAYSLWLTYSCKCITYYHMQKLSTTFGLFVCFIFSHDCVHSFKHTFLEELTLLVNSCISKNYKAARAAFLLPPLWCAWQCMWTSLESENSYIEKFYICCCCFSLLFHQDSESLLNPWLVTWSYPGVSAYLLSLCLLPVPNLYMLPLSLSHGHSEEIASALWI